MAYLVLCVYGDYRYVINQTGDIILLLIMTGFSLTGPGIDLTGIDHRPNLDLTWMKVGNDLDVNVTGCRSGVDHLLVIRLTKMSRR